MFLHIYTCLFIKLKAEENPDVFKTWYPPLEKTLSCLSKLYRCLEQAVFTGLAQVFKFLDYQFFYTSHLFNWLSWLFCWKLGCLIPLSGSSRSLLHVYPSKYAKERTLYTVECNTEKSLCISTMSHTILWYQWKSGCLCGEEGIWLWPPYVELLFMIPI